MNLPNWITCNIRKVGGERVYAELKGYVSSEKGNSYQKMSHENIEVVVWEFAEDGESKPIYRGSLEDLKVIYKNELCLLEIRSVSWKGI